MCSGWQLFLLVAGVYCCRQDCVLLLEGWFVVSCNVFVAVVCAVVGRNACPFLVMCVCSW